MAITYTNDYATISTTEYSFPADASGPTSQTTDGIFQFFVDFNALALGDQFRLRLYEKYDSSGTQRLVEEWIFTGPQGKPGWFSPSFILGEGWDFTCIKLAGTDRSIPWSIRKVA
jgi:hypothetical protein